MMGTDSFAHRVIALILVVAQIAAATEQPRLSNLPVSVTVDYDQYTFSKSPNGANNLQRFQLVGNYASTGRPYSAFAATFEADHFAFFPSKTNGCTELVQTSVSSSTSYTCDYATNGAFFTWDMPETGSLCIGNLVSDGKVWQTPTDGTGTSRANFGLTKDGQVIVGFISDDIIQSTSFSQLITGWGWLVRNGKSYVDSSQDLTYSPGGFTMEKAPRTAVGVFKNGTMALLEIDGEEDINAGPDLFELAELFVSIGIESAINIDGGGSSVSVYQGKVVDVPTCNDTPEVCERAVASITCVKA